MYAELTTFCPANISPFRWLLCFSLIRRFATTNRRTHLRPLPRRLPTSLAAEPPAHRKAPKRRLRRMVRRLPPSIIRPPRRTTQPPTTAQSVRPAQTDQRPRRLPPIGIGSSPRHSRRPKEPSRATTASPA